MSTKTNTSTTKTTKTTTTKAPSGIPTGSRVIDGVYALKGKGKNRIYMAAVRNEDNPQVGDVVRLHTAYKGHNLGRLTTVAVPADSDGMVRWNFDQMRNTPEQTAENRRLKAQYVADYYASDKGKETAAKIVARQAAKEDAAKVADVVADVVPAATVAPATVADGGRAALMADLKAAGFSIADIMAHLSALPTAAPATVQSAPVAPKAPATKAPSTTKANPVVIKLQCASCGDQEVTKLYDHVAGAKVCNPCMDLDTATVQARIDRRNGTTK